MNPPLARTGIGATTVETLVACTRISRPNLAVARETIGSFAPNSRAPRTDHHVRLWHAQAILHRGSLPRSLASRTIPRSPPATPATAETALIRPDFFRGAEIGGRGRSDREVTCAGRGTTFSAADADGVRRDRALPALPFCRFCRICPDRRLADRNTRSRSCYLTAEARPGPSAQGGRTGGSATRYVTICATCGHETRIPFRPNDDRPVSCQSRL